ncbi:Invasin [Buttiauxella agrestis]|uniref:Invasin n=1 Tax=Buttiauxella agrestis TaxID=82977 RepID=A0A381KPY2_9ENTR|nr:Ig-like domain-containing protein [Buttiauxella agrestis]SUY92705.1 Invasin [Buttiauxella agrestis]
MNRSQRNFDCKNIALTWLIVVIQFIWPVTLAFAPVISVAAQDINQPMKGIRTIPYILGPNETVYTQAKKNHLTIEELKKLNQFRSFSKQFTQLTTGDELDIPAPENKFLMQSDEQPAGYDANIVGQDLSQAGSMLANSNASDAVASMARSQITDVANSNAQQWLSLFGTAKVKLSLDSNNDLDGSEIDWLAPIYDNKTNLLFTQLGARNQDGRNTVNMGVGFRTLTDQWMVGANTFFDNDITGKNRRLGAGFEAWRDYLKLSVNGYFALTDWHQSRDFDDYNERPANGFDIRSEAYLPSYPQLGGKLMYEKYYGDSVALTDKDSRSKNPQAVTLGVSFTPVPLLTVGVDHHKGESGDNDSSISLQLTYRPGMSLASHLDPNEVNNLRMLSGSRLDLVDRNNSIVLDYQKQDLMRITLPDRLSGASKQTIYLVAQVSSKYSVDHIEWDTAAVVAAGGVTTQLSSTTLAVTLPPYQAFGNNSYSVSGMAWDVKGNASERALSLLEVEKPIDMNITLKATIDGSPADGVTVNRVDAKVTDSNKQPVAGQSVTFSQAGNSAELTTTKAITDSTGLASTLLTSTKTGITNITGTLDSGESKTVDSTFVADMTNATLSLAVTKDNAMSNGTDTNTIEASLLDNSGNPLTGQVIIFSASHGATLDSSSATTDARGVAKIIVTNTVDGISTITAKINNLSQSVDTHFGVDNSSADITTQNITVLNDNAAADGVATDSVMVKVTDIHNTPMADQKVTFSVESGSAKAETTTRVSDSQGQASATFTSLKADTSVVHAQLANGQGQSIPISFIPDTGTATITSANLTVTADGAVANGTATNEVQAIVTDTAGNLVPGASVTFTATNGATVTTASATTGADGKATTTLTSLKAGDSSVTAGINGSSQTVKTTFVPDSSTATITSANLTVTADGAVANGTATNAVQAIVTDGRGQVVSGIGVTFSGTNGATMQPTVVFTDTNGIASATLTSLTAGESAVTAEVNGNSQTVKTMFIADASTATVISNNLTVTDDDAQADGTSTNTVQAIVTDAHDNVLSGITVKFSANNGGHIITDNIITDAQGKASTMLTNTTAGKTVVTATVNGTGTTVNTNFVPDAGTAVIKNGSLIVTIDGAVANGTATNAVQATVTDANNNPISGYVVTFVATNGAKVQTSNATTGADGKASTTLTSLTAGVSHVTAEAGTSSTMVNVSFTSDVSTATIVVVADSRAVVADGVTTATWTATVKDANNNLVSGMPITWKSSNNEITPLSATGTTGDSGAVTTTAKSLKSGDVVMTATLAAPAQSASAENVKFIGDTRTAVIDNLISDKISVVSDNADKATLSATVLDANNNLVPNAVVTWSTDNNQLQAGSTITDSKGVATVTIKGNTVSKTTITAAINNSKKKVSISFAFRSQEDWDPVSDDTNGNKYYGKSTSGTTHTGFIVLSGTTGPTTLQNSSSYGTKATLTTQMQDKQGNLHTVIFKGLRDNAAGACGYTEFNSIVACGGSPTVNPLLYFYASDNPGLPAGVYDGQLHFSAQDQNGTFAVEYIVSVKLTMK